MWVRSKGAPRAGRPVPNGAVDPSRWPSKHRGRVAPGCLARCRVALRTYRGDDRVRFPSGGRFFDLSPLHRLPARVRGSGNGMAKPAPGRGVHSSRDGPRQLPRAHPVAPQRAVPSAPRSCQQLRREHPRASRMAGHSSAKRCAPIPRGASTAHWGAMDSPREGTRVLPRDHQASPCTALEGSLESCQALRRWHSSAIPGWHDSSLHGCAQPSGSWRPQPMLLSNGSSRQPSSCRSVSRDPRVTGHGFRAQATSSRPVRDEPSRQGTDPGLMPRLSRAVPRDPRLEAADSVSVATKPRALALGSGPQAS